METNYKTILIGYVLVNLVLVLLTYSTTYYSSWNSFLYLLPFNLLCYGVLLVETGVVGLWIKWRQRVISNGAIIIYQIIAALPVYFFAFIVDGLAQHSV